MHSNIRNNETCELLTQESIHIIIETIKLKFSNLKFSKIAERTSLKSVKY